MSVADLSNSSIEFDIDGKTYKVKKLNILDIFVKFETDIRQDYIQSISDMAKILDSKDRAEFLKNAIKELPTGRSLEDKVDEKMNTIQGGVDLLYTILQKCQEVSKNDIITMVSKESNGEVINSIVSYALGQSKNEASEAVGDPNQKK